MTGLLLFVRLLCVSSSSDYFDAPRPVWRRRRFRFLLVLVVVGLLAVGATRSALAYSGDCSTAFDPVVCERVEAGTEAAQDTRTLVGWSVGVLLVVASAPVLIRIFRGTS